MDNISDSTKGSKPASSVGKPALPVGKSSVWYKAHQWYLRNRADLTLFLFVFLTISALIGLWRLYELSPPKEPISIEES